MAQLGLVQVASGLGVREQLGGVQRPPLPVIGRAGEVGDQHTGVEQRVVGSAGAMPERGRDEALHRHDLGPAGAAAGEPGRAFEVADCGVHALVARMRHSSTRTTVCRRRAEHQVPATGDAEGSRTPTTSAGAKHPTTGGGSWSPRTPWTSFMQLLHGAARAQGLVAERSARSASRRMPGPSGPCSSQPRPLGPLARQHIPMTGSAPTAVDRGLAGVFSRGRCSTPRAGLRRVRSLSGGAAARCE
jgi:hypothetical protein